MAHGGLHQKKQKKGKFKFSPDNTRAVIDINVIKF